MITTFRQEVSINGYPLDILKSGLQKYIRRGMIEKALYCAGELDLFKQAPERGETIRTNFIHRLMVIYLEDVLYVPILYRLHTHFMTVFNERTKPERDVHLEEIELATIVTLLSHSPKARIMSHVRSVFYDKYYAIRKYYPSLQKLWTNTDSTVCGLDKLSLRFNKALYARDLSVIYYGFKIYKCDEKLDTRVGGKSGAVWLIFQKLMEVFPEGEEMIKIMMVWYDKHLCNLGEGFMCWLVPLLCYLGVIPFVDDEKINGDSCANHEGWQKNKNGSKITIDPFVIDRHTKKGSRGSSILNFALVGAKVENEAEWINPVWKLFYEDSKRFEMGEQVIGEQQVVVSSSSSSSSNILYETEEYELLVRTQLTTGKSKQDVYFARDKSGKRVVVKGPFPKIIKIINLQENKKWKIKNKLPFVNFQVKRMIPDRWPDGVPLGIRNHINRNSLAWFVIFEDVLDDIPVLPTMMRSSTLWSETAVVDWSQLQFHFKMELATSEQMRDYVHALLYRYVRGIPDLADRNFLFVKGRVISIDEDIRHSNVNMTGELKKNKCATVREWLSQNTIDISSWVALDEFEQKRIDKIKGDIYDLFTIPLIQISSTLEIASEKHD